MNFLRWSLIVVAIAACGHGHDDVEVPADFAGLTNPFAGDTTAAAAGDVLYAEHCADCHGAGGRGDGPLAGGMTPAPPDFLDHTLGHEDDYIYWRIMEGGMAPPFNSAMPRWDDVMSTDEVWQVVTHLRSLEQ